MQYLLKGALVEYGSDFLGPLPNVVIFQFNPENLKRNIQIPTRPTGAGARETSQAGEIPVGKMTLVAHFNASDRLGRQDPLARMFGVGPQLAALEKMAAPPGNLFGLIGEAIDAVGAQLGLGGSGIQPIPREKYPRTLFIWGLTRVWPVIIDSISIDEQHFDNMLNPIEAEVSIGLSVINIDPCSDDVVGKGAQQYSNIAKEALAMTNLANTVAEALDLIPF